MHAIFRFAKSRLLFAIATAVFASACGQDEASPSPGRGATTQPAEKQFAEAFKKAR